jgi:hypothetical protein
MAKATKAEREYRERADRGADIVDGVIAKATGGAVATAPTEPSAGDSVTQSQEQPGAAAASDAAAMHGQKLTLIDNGVFIAPGGLAKIEPANEATAPAVPADADGAVPGWRTKIHRTLSPAERAASQRAADWETYRRLIPKSPDLSGAEQMELSGVMMRLNKSPENVAADATILAEAERCKACIESARELRREAIAADEAERAAWETFKRKKGEIEAELGKARQAAREAHTRANHTGAYGADLASLCAQHPELLAPFKSR